MSSVRRTHFNLLFQPHRIGKQRNKAEMKKPYLWTMLPKRTKMVDIRINSVSRKTRILSRLTKMRMIIMNIKLGRKMRPSRSFMVKRCSVI